MNKEQLLNAREEWKANKTKRQEERIEKIIKKWQDDFIKYECNHINISDLENLEQEMLKNKLRKRGFDFKIKEIPSLDYYDYILTITNL